MIPTIVLMGKSNVGKTSLFNFLTCSSDSIIDDSMQTTRDRNYGYLLIKKKKISIIDTAGINFLKKEKKKKSINYQSYQQTKTAMLESNLIIFLVDVKTGITEIDYFILNKIRKTGKPFILLVNKIDLINQEEKTFDFFNFGVKKIYNISILHRIGINDFIKKLLSFYTNFQKQENFKKKKDFNISNEIKIKSCLIGKPNVGKSSIINRILNSNRIITSPIPGTTRDIVRISYKKKKFKYIFIDTAGIQKNHKKKKYLEKISEIKSLKTIKCNDITIIVIDANTGVCSQDLTILSYVIKSSRPFFILVNKWDLISKNKKKNIKQEINNKLFFIKKIKVIYISALKKTNFKKIFNQISIIYKESLKNFNSSLLTNTVYQAVIRHPLPMGVKGKIIRLKYAHLSGKKPILIVIHGTQTQKIPTTYKKYLINFLQNKLKIPNTPIRLLFKNNNNPYILKN